MVPVTIAQLCPCGRESSPRQSINQQAWPYSIELYTDGSLVILGPGGAFATLHPVSEALSLVHRNPLPLKSIGYAKFVF